MITAAYFYCLIVVGPITDEIKDPFSVVTKNYWDSRDRLWLLDSVKNLCCCMQQQMILWMWMFLWLCTKLMSPFHTRGKEDFIIKSTLPCGNSTCNIVQKLFSVLLEEYRLSISLGKIYTNLIMCEIWMRNKRMIMQILCWFVYHL